MKKPVLLLTVGLPRSGKSTWARATGYPVVNPDSIRMVLHGTAWRPEAEPMVWATANLMVQALFEAGHEVVVLDATNLTEHRRAEWNSKKWTTGYVTFHTDEATCIARAEAGDRAYLIPVIQRMARDIEWPMKPVYTETQAGGRTLTYIPA